MSRFYQEISHILSGVKAVLGADKNMRTMTVKELKKQIKDGGLGFGTASCATCSCECRCHVKTKN